MSRLYNWKARQWENVRDEDVTDMVASGRYSFEQGIDIPVVSPNGQLGTIKAEEVEQAFKQGYRWQTKVDQDEYYEKESRKIHEEAYDNPLAAISAGIWRGATFGLSDVGFRALDELTGSEFSKGLDALKRENPISSGVGSAAGMLLNPLTRAAGTGLFKAGESALTSAKTVSKAQEIVRGLSGAGLGSAAEGAFYGLGEGISEAALGRPDEIVENVLTQTGMGTVFGGLFGPAFKGVQQASPLVKDVASKTFNVFDKMTQKANQKIAKGMMAPALLLKKEKEARKAIGDLVDHPEARKAYYGGGEEEFKRVLKELPDVNKAFKEKVQKDRNEITKYLKLLPDDEKESIEKILPKFGGDVVAARNKIWNELVAARSEYVEIMKSNTKPAVLADKIYDSTDDVMKGLGKLRDRDAKRISKELNMILDSKVPPKVYGLPRDQRSQAVLEEFTEGTEVLLARELRRFADDSIYQDKVKGKTRELLKEYVSDLNATALKGNKNPNIAKYQKHMDDFNTTYTNLNGLINKMVLKEGAFSNDKVVKSFMSPERVGKLNTLFDNIAEFTGHLEAYKQAGKDIESRTAILKSIERDIRRFKKGTPDDLRDPKAIQSILDDITTGLGKKPGDITKHVEALRKAQETMQAAGDMTPASKYVLIKKALGLEVDKNIEDFIQYDKQFEQLYSMVPKGEPSSKVLSRLGRVALGGTVFGPAAGAVIAGVEAVGAAGSNPYRTLKTLTTIEKWSNKGHQLTNRVFDGAVNKLTSDKARKSVLLLKAQEKPLKERRKEHKKNKEVLKQFSNPQAAHEHISNKIDILEGAPQIQMAMAMKMTQIADFLMQKMPQDPFAANAIMVGTTKWEPSDAELTEFERYVSAVERPLEVVERIGNGDATQEEIETVKTVYPNLYNRLQSELLNAITETGGEMTYSQKLAIAELLNVPVDATLSPDFIASMQQNFVQQDKGGRPQGSKTKKFNVEPEETVATDVTRITNS